MKKQTDRDSRVGRSRGRSQHSNTEFAIHKRGYLRLAKDANAIDRCSAEIFHGGENGDRDRMASPLSHCQQRYAEDRFLHILDFVLTLLKIIEMQTDERTCVCVVRHLLFSVDAVE